MNTATDTAAKRITITMTGRPPVRIREDLWPLIAEGEHHDYEGEFESQANRSWQCKIRVRQHADGRAIVSGFYLFDTRWQHERIVSVRAGELLEAGTDIVARSRARARGHQSR